VEDAMNDQRAAEVVNADSQCEHPNVKKVEPEWMAYSGEHVIRLSCPDCKATTEVDLGDIGWEWDG
jgi:hypothetical protein